MAEHEVKVQKWSLKEGWMTVSTEKAEGGVVYRDDYPRSLALRSGVPASFGYRYGDREEMGFKAGEPLTEVSIYKWPGYKRPRYIRPGESVSVGVGLGWRVNIFRKSEPSEKDSK